jgi:hypothetical protein
MNTIPDLHFCVWTFILSGLLALSTQPENIAAYSKILKSSYHYYKNGKAVLVLPVLNKLNTMPWRHVG